MRPSASFARLLACLSLLPALAAAQAAAAQAYAPTLQKCPDGTALLRSPGSDPHAQTLSPDETRYIAERRASVLPVAWAAYLATVTAASASGGLPEYVAKILGGAYGADALPHIGIATSGGGLRAALFGAGVLSALDGRNQSSVRAGTGGLLQTAEYISGLSGGSWLVSSLAQADFPLLPDLVFGASSSEGGYGGWITDIDLLQPSSNSTSTTAVLGVFLQEIALKRTAGFPVTVADVWGRSLARHFVNGTTEADFFDASLTHGAGQTLSGVADVSTFQSRAQPFPIVLADSLSSGPGASETAVPLANPIYEFNVYETGSYDPALGTFTPTRFLGSPPNGSVCVTGFDQLSFVQAASSNLFNSLNTSDAALLASPIGPIVGALETLFPQPGLRLDVAAVPNPFVGVAPDTYADAGSADLALVDGGEDGETTPFQPLLVRARGVDTIIAIDAPADTDDNFADGSSLIATSARVQLLSPAYAFPPIPSTPAEFLAHNLTTRPTFFGCASAASSGEPLVVYIANGGAPLGQHPVTNAPTTKLAYTQDEAQAVLDQVYDVATQGIPVDGAGRGGAPGKDTEWPVCLACAVVERARRSLGVPRTGACASCLERYCWS
ncbi:lysophospholipase [Trametes meyenii]|nr:lysophospholipase [Trametes meyenii]